MNKQELIDQIRSTLKEQYFKKFLKTGYLDDCYYEIDLHVDRLEKHGTLEEVQDTMFKIEEAILRNL